MTNKKVISYKDKMLLEEFEEKYTPQELLQTIEKIKGNESPESTTVNSKNDIQIGFGSVEEAVLDYIRKLEGYRVRLREFHWSASKMSTHELTDNLMSDLTDYEDSVAEETMGILGFRIKVGSIIPVIPEVSDLKSLLTSLISDTLTLRACVEDDKNFAGIVSILDDIEHDINKSKYLETFE